MVKKRSKHSKSESSFQKRRPWTAKEDSAIRALVHENGIKQWTLIAENLQKRYNILGRTGKQCRERWHNHLNTGIIKNPWTSQEELVLFNTHKKMGNKWAEISKEIPGRTDNSIKNHFYSTIRKFYRKIFGREGTADEIRVSLKEVTEAVIESLTLDRVCAHNDESLTSGSIENEDIFPDFSDMIITGHGIKVPDDWGFMDFQFEDEHEVMLYPMSPCEEYYLMKS